MIRTHGKAETSRVQRLRLLYTAGSREESSAWLSRKAQGAFSKVISARHKPFFFLRDYSILSKGEIQNKKVGVSVCCVVQGPLRTLPKLEWVLGAEKELSCHCPEELFLRNQKLPSCRAPGSPRSLVGQQETTLH